MYFSLHVRYNILKRSSLFWNVTQPRMVVTDFSVQPIGPILKGEAGPLIWD